MVVETLSFNILKEQIIPKAIELKDRGELSKKLEDII